MIGADGESERDHGAHTLRVFTGTIVGIFGNDVFLEFGGRMQGVISRGEFERAPRLGDTCDVTLRGQEESLWVCSLREAESLSSWEEMEEGSLVQAKVVRTKHGGLELKIGPLHAFMPASQSGLPRDHKLDELVGKTITCEVIEVDRERQRVLVSRKEVLRRERASGFDQRIGNLTIGQVVQGRVSRIESYGAFVEFGRGLRGLIHVSDLSHERVDDPKDVLSIGQNIEAKVLYVKRRGKRIALGLKQMQVSPWIDFAKRYAEGDVLSGVVARVVSYGAFVRLGPGVQGLLHRSETTLDKHGAVASRLHVGDTLACRIVTLHPELGRMALSNLHRDGRPLRLEEASTEHGHGWRQSEAEPNTLGAILKRALEGH